MAMREGQLFKVMKYFFKLIQKTLLKKQSLSHKEKSRSVMLTEVYRYSVINITLAVIF